jgi:hypothetical protein
MYVLFRDSFGVYGDKGVERTSTFIRAENRGEKFCRVEHKLFPCLAESIRSQSAFFTLKSLICELTHRFSP